MTDSVVKIQEELDDTLGKLREIADKAEDDLNTLMTRILKSKIKINENEIKEFLKKYWLILPTKDPYRFRIAVPQFIPFPVGEFEERIGGYNVFLVDQYTQWLGEEIPPFIQREINIPQPWNIHVEDGALLFPEGDQERVKEEFGDHLMLVGTKNASIKKGHEFFLIAEIIRRGSLPFIPMKVQEGDLRESDFTKIWDERKKEYSPLEIFEGKYAFQGKAWQKFLECGAICVTWKMGLGKTVISTYIFSRIKGPKALIVPLKTLEEQWRNFFKMNCPRLLEEVDIYTYQGLSKSSWEKIKSKQFSVVIFDECQVLPAKSFIKLATIKTKYRGGLTATFYREDDIGPEFIIALSGTPVGVDWYGTMELLAKEFHEINVHIVDNFKTKLRLLQRLYDPNERTLIFVELIKTGERISEMLQIPFIQGKTKNRIEIIKNNRSIIASRTLDLGISISDLQRIIEVGFQKGSRRQEAQRGGRLFHSDERGKTHDILFTQEEFEKFEKRISPFVGVGFSIRVIDHTTKRKIKRKKRKSKEKNHLEIIEELYNDGYFKERRSLADVRKQVKKRGIKVDTIITRRIFSKLQNMTRGKRLFKIETKDGYKFEQR